MKSTDIDKVLYPSNFLPQAIRLVIKLKETEFKKQKKRKQKKQNKTKKDKKKQNKKAQEAWKLEH
jgi:hypothetical protein